jgi:outer membrane receptor protein involved in Fe transport
MQGPWRLLGRVDYFGEYYESHLEDDTLSIDGEAAFLVDGEVGYKVTENVELIASAQNLFDQDYLQVGFNGPFQVDENNDSISVYNAFLGAPRTIGATLRVDF